jgi:CRISPR-associated protein Cas5d
MAEQSRRYHLRMRGELACFARPELKTERVTYSIPTPSALRGILEAILWKPAIRWHIDEIRLLRPIRYLQFRRNEVNSRASDRTAHLKARTGEAWNYYADEDRAQRNTIALRDVDYAVEAHFEWTARRGPDDSIRKFEEMFERRLDKGQHVTPPVFGCREFPAIVERYLGDPPALMHDEDFGWMLHDIRFGPTNTPVFFHAVMRRGRLPVPPFPEKGDVAS